MLLFFFVVCFAGAAGDIRNRFFDSSEMLYGIYKYALNAAFACRNIYINTLTLCTRAMLISIAILYNQPFLRLSEVHIPWDESILNAENLRKSSKKKKDRNPIWASVLLPGGI